MVWIQPNQKRGVGVIRVKVPATTANLGPGFDTLGMALTLYNYVEMQETENPGECTVEIQGEGADSIHPDQRNVAWQAAQKVFQRVHYDPLGIKLRLINQIPSARGLGSSAAARVGGLLAANCLAGNPLGPDQLLALAVELEGHPDNVAPALFGGLVISSVLPNKQVIWRKISVSTELHTVLVIPNFELATQKAVDILPAQIPRQDAVYNIGQACLLVAGFLTQDWSLVSQAMGDHMHQIYRQSLIPGLGEVISAARKSGALGSALSGAGPTVLALVLEQTPGLDHSAFSHQIGQAMQAVFQQFDVESTFRILKPCNQGATIHRI